MLIQNIPTSPRELQTEQQARYFALYRASDLRARGHHWPTLHSYMGFAGSISGYNARATALVYARNYEGENPLSNQPIIQRQQPWLQRVRK